MDFKHENDRIYLENENGKCIAEVTIGLKNILSTAI